MGWTDVEQRVLKQDLLLRALTGLNRKAFEELMAAFSPLFEQTCQTKPRQRAVGGGCKARLLGNREKLFFILFYFKCYPTFDLVGIIFDMHRSQAHEWMHRSSFESIQGGLGKCTYWSQALQRSKCHLSQPKSGI